MTGGAILGHFPPLVSGRELRVASAYKYWDSLLNISIFDTPRILNSISTNIGKGNVNIAKDDENSILKQKRLRKMKVHTWWWKGQGGGFPGKVGKRISSNGDRKGIGPLRWWRGNCWGTWCTRTWRCSPRIWEAPATGTMVSLADNKVVTVVVVLAGPSDNPSQRPAATSTTSPLRQRREEELQCLRRR